MASGVGSSRSEPRKRVVASRLRTDSGDVSSLASMPLEDRPNNWDFSDWRPASTLDTGKRIKKDNPEKEKEKEWQRELERVRERVRAGSPGDNERRHTPATFPRTRVTPGMRPSQRLALENLRQHMTFSDAEEAAVEADGIQECRSNMLAAAADRHHNLAQGAQCNGISEDPPDSSQIVGRLMQIRDYIKQASTMMQNLLRSTDQSDQSRAHQLQQVVTRLRDQEQKYLDLLLKITAPDNGADTGLEETTTGGEDSNASESEAASVDLEVRSMQSDATDNTTADLLKKNDELEALREQHDLLKKMLYQQEQLRALQGRQAALQALQADAERKLREEQAGAAGASAAAPVEEAAEADQALIPAELQDLRSRLNYFKNIYDIKEQVEETSTASMAPASELSVMSLERRQLEDKLTDLQQKKVQMDSLLAELQTLRGARDIGTDGASGTSSQDHLAASLTASVLANRTAAEAQDMLDVLESRKKLHKLQEVRERLNQLRNLVQYYQSGTEFIHGTQPSPPPLASTNNLSTNHTSFRDKRSRESVASKFKQYGEGTLTSASESQNASEVASTSQNGSDTESNLSSTIGAWGDDPSVRTKVHKLKAAKEKLHRLQELVAMVQESPDLMTALPEHLAQLASSIDGSVSGIQGPSAIQGPSGNQDASNSLQDVIAAPASQQVAQQLHQAEKDFNYIREELYAARMQEQREELEQLMAERHKLVAIQDQLQQLYQQLPGNASGPHWRGKEDGPVSEELPASASEAEDEPPTARSKPAPDGNQVTFQEPLETVASYDELYGRMRQQRMLREELRDKKKELENMMRKDRPRKHYFRNQDNQSDNVSFSNKSDPYSYVPTTASGEVTMATWGGSTADNLESIEEDGCQAQQEEDDGYPSDGLLQVEEEEEAEVESDDRDTYTIEDEYHSRARHNARGDITQTAALAGGRLPLSAGKWSTGRGRRNRPSSQSRQQMDGCEMCGGNNNGPLTVLHSHLQSLQQTLAQTQAQITDMHPGMYVGSPTMMQPPMLLLQLANCCQSMALQQQDSSERLRRLETALLSPGGMSACQTPNQLSMSPGGEMTMAQQSVNQHLQALYQCQATSPAPHLEAGASTAEDVPIQTIQASDQRLPPLPLAALHKQRTHNRPEANPLNKKSANSTNSNEAVIGRKFVTPSRTTAAQRLASRQQGAPHVSTRPGLSAGISGTTFDTTSLSSYLSSVPGGPATQTTEKALQHNTSATGPNNRRESDSGDFSLFEALRDTIYSEVATLISQNENRPHFLIELFREMQLLSNDYLRQRALYAIQDLVTKQLTDDDMPARNATAGQALKSMRQATAGKAAQRGSVQGATFDYVEPLDSASSLSTPNSSTCPGDTPFAKESLGDTVIHLDKALQKMREYEQRLIELDAKDSVTAAVAAAQPAPPPPPASQQDTESIASSSAADQASQSSASDFPQSPRIDTQQLDRQIKAIMTQIIPVLKEHMADVCSQQLLQYIRRLVLSLTRQKDNSHEFVRFFHKQLGSILQDSLTKFEGLKMRDCGEDLLVELSEILFNELAFFRLMQDLDDPKARVKDSIRKWRQGSQTSTETGGEKEDESVAGDTTEMSETEGELSDNESEQQDGDKDINEAATETEDEAGEGTMEEENLGKARDDELAARMDIIEQDEDSESPAKQDVRIMLAPSETKPYTRIGSDEDDEGEDEVQSAEDPSDTAVSRDVASEGNRLLPPGMTADRTASPCPSYEDDFEPSQGSMDAEEVEEDLVVENMDGSGITTDTDAASEQTEASDEANVTVLSQPTVNGVLENPVVLNGEQAASLEVRAESEEQQTSGLQAVLKSMEVPSELAGDPAALKQPGS